jgi:hypothetical protein
MNCKRIAICLVVASVVSGCTTPQPSPDTTNAGSAGPATDGPAAGSGADPGADTLTMLEARHADADADAGHDEKTASSEAPVLTAEGECLQGKLEERCEPSGTCGLSLQEHRSALREAIATGRCGWLLDAGCTTSDGRNYWVVEWIRLRPGSERLFFDADLGTLASIRIDTDVPEYCGRSSYSAWFGPVIDCELPSTSMPSDQCGMSCDEEAPNWTTEDCVQLPDDGGG